MELKILIKGRPPINWEFNENQDYREYLIRPAIKQLLFFFFRTFSGNTMFRVGIFLVKCYFFPCSSHILLISMMCLCIVFSVKVSLYTCRFFPVFLSKLECHLFSIVSCLSIVNFIFWSLREVTWLLPLCVLPVSCGKRIRQVFLF